MARRLRSRVRGRTVTPPPNVGPTEIRCYLNRIRKTKSNKELVKGQGAGYTAAMSPGIAETPPPSRTRWMILALLLAISIVTYIDRVNISVTARQIMPALGLTDMQMGQVFSAFVLGYALFQIPGGWLGDRRKPLPRADPLAGRASGMVHRTGGSRAGRAARRSAVGQNQTGGRATREGCGITIGLLDSSHVLGHEIREKKPAGCDFDQIRRVGGQVLSG